MWSPAVIGSAVVRVNLTAWLPFYSCLFVCSCVPLKDAHFDYGRVIGNEAIRTKLNALLSAMPVCAYAILCRLRMRMGSAAGFSTSSHSPADIFGVCLCGIVCRL